MTERTWISNVFMFGKHIGGGWAEDVIPSKSTWAEAAQREMEQNPADHIIYYYETHFNVADIPMSVYFDIIRLNDLEFEERTRSCSEYRIHAIHRRVQS